jgi:hypothetical protein
MQTNPRRGLGIELPGPHSGAHAMLGGCRKRRADFGRYQWKYKLLAFLRHSKAAVQIYFFLFDHGLFLKTIFLANDSSHLKDTMCYRTTQVKLYASLPDENDDIRTVLVSFWWFLMLDIDID